MLTPVGERVVARARHVLAEVEDLTREFSAPDGLLRIGHAWSAVGEPMLDFQRRWAQQHPEVVLQVVRTNSPTGGLAEGLCDRAIVRSPPETRRGLDGRFDSAVVGLESRFCALAEDDPWREVATCGSPT